MLLGNRLFGSAWKFAMSGETVGPAATVDVVVVVVVGAVVVVTAEVAAGAVVSVTAEVAAGAVVATAVVAAGAVVGGSDGVSAGAVVGAAGAAGAAVGAGAAAQPARNTITTRTLSAFHIVCFIALSESTCNLPVRWAATGVDADLRGFTRIYASRPYPIAPFV